MYEFPMTAPQGWQCPICKRVYSPTYPWCIFCGNEQTTTTTTTTVKTDPSQYSTPNDLMAELMRKNREQIESLGLTSTSTSYTLKPNETITAEM